MLGGKRTHLIQREPKNKGTINSRDGWDISLILKSRCNVSFFDSFVNAHDIHPLTHSGTFDLLTKKLGNTLF